MTRPAGTSSFLCKEVTFTAREDVVIFAPGYGDEGNFADIIRTMVDDDSGVSNPVISWEQYGVCTCIGHCFLRLDRLRDVRELLAKHDYHVEGMYVERWPQLDRAMQPERLPGLAPDEKSMLSSIREAPWGQIQVPPERVPGMIAALAELYPQENILVIAKNTESVGRIAGELEQRTERAVSRGIEVRRDRQPLVHIEALSGLCRTAHDWQVLIFADAESARSDTGMEQALSMPESLIFAFTPVGHDMDDEDQLRLRLTSGPVVFQRPEFRWAPDTETTVVTVRARRARKRRQRNPLEQKRRQIWHNPGRNQQVAAVAAAFACLDRAKLQECGIPIEEIERQLVELGAEPRVAIVVESPEHARRLRKELPQWRLATGRRASEYGTDFPLDEPKVIVTRTRAVVDELAADVVILADGTADAWDDRLGPNVLFSDRCMLVVDFQDGFDRDATLWAQHRLGSYRERKWNVIEHAHALLAQ